MTIAARLRHRGLFVGLVAALVSGALVAPTAQGAGTASISGTITNANTLGVDTATLYDLSWNEIGTVETSSAFSFTSLAAGSYYVGFDVTEPASAQPLTWATDNAASYYYLPAGGTATVKPESAKLWTSVTVTDGQTLDLGAVALVKGSQITSKVVCPNGTSPAPFIAAAIPLGQRQTERYSMSNTNPATIRGLSGMPYGVLAYNCGLFIFSGNTLNPGKMVPVNASATPGATVTMPALDMRSARLFTDVSAYTAFVREIQWMVMAGLTTGYGDGSYRPLGSVNRDAMAAFLYRMAEGNYTGSRSCFKDVPATSQFAKEICWLKSTGITTGYGDGTFRPLLPVARDAMAAYMYRYAAWSGRPGNLTGLTTQRFVDVPPRKQFFREINWMAVNGISTGYGDGTYRPLDPVHRDAMAAFLSRLNDKVLLPQGMAVQGNSAGSLAALAPALTSLSVR